MKYKNAILILVAVLLFAYAGLITVFPKVLTKSFNIEEFEKKVCDATSLVTTIDSIDFKVTPTLDMIITIANWSSKYVDMQDCFDSKAIVLTTNVSSVFTKNFFIKKLYLKNVKFSNQTLPDGNNKLAFLPGAFKSEVFGAKKIVIVPGGDVRIKLYEQKDIGPKSYDEKKLNEVIYTKEDVKGFLSKFQFAHIEVR